MHIIVNNTSMVPIYEQIMDHIVKSYNDFTLDCSMEIQPGCITGLIGQNGAGKTTTFKAILNLIDPDGGTVELFGKKVENLTAQDKQKLGVALSDSGFSEQLTIQDVIHILKAMYPSFVDKKFINCCQKFQLPMEKKLKEFSTGMKAKFKVIVALSHEAQFLILDEPTVGLDVVARDEVLELLHDYMEEDESRSILISSHISSDLESLCDDIYMLHEGKIVLHEETDRLLDDYALLKPSKEQLETMDKEYILKYKEETYGCRCLTNQKQYYMENYPEVVLEKGNIDDLMALMIGGKEL